MTITKAEVDEIRRLYADTEFRSVVSLTHYQVAGLVEAWDRLQAVLRAASGHLRAATPDDADGR